MSTSRFERLAYWVRTLPEELRSRIYYTFLTNRLRSMHSELLARPPFNRPRQVNKLLGLDVLTHDELWESLYPDFVEGLPRHMAAKRRTDNEDYFYRLGSYYHGRDPGGGRPPFDRPA